MICMGWTFMSRSSSSRLLDTETLNLTLQSLHRRVHASTAPAIVWCPDSNIQGTGGLLGMRHETI